MTTHRLNKKVNEDKTSTEDKVLVLVVALSVIVISVFFLWLIFSGMQMFFYYSVNSLLDWWTYLDLAYKTIIIGCSIITVSVAIILIRIWIS